MTCDNVNVPAVLLALRDYGEKCGVDDTQGTDRKTEYIFKRVKKRGTEAIELKSIEELGIIDRIKRFFGHRDFRLDTISRLIARSLSFRQNDPKLFQDMVAPISRELSVALSRLQKKIQGQKSLTRIDKLIGRAQAESIDTGAINLVVELAKKCLSDSPPPHSLAGKGKGEGVVVSGFSEIDGAKLRGIQNPGCLCYCNSLIKAFAASPSFRRALVEAKTEMGNAFLEVCKDLDSSRKSPLSHRSGKLSALNRLLCKKFPQLRRVYNQQDVQDLMVPFLAAALTGSDPKSSPNFRMRRVAKRAPETQEYALYRKFYGLPSVQDLCIPTIDREIQAEEHSAVIINLPGERERIDIQDFFTGRRGEIAVTLNDIAGSEAAQKDPTKLVNISDLPPAVDRNMVLPGIESIESSELQGEPPAFLPVYVPRFINTRAATRKNCAPVNIPFLLDVPVEGDQTAFYQLRSVAVHFGSTLNSGHYVCYIPDPTTVQEDTGMPLSWTKHSDSHVEPVSWDPFQMTPTRFPGSEHGVKADIEQNGCIYVYDLVGGSIPSSA